MLRPSWPTRLTGTFVPLVFILSCSQAGNIPSFRLDESFTKAKVLPQTRFGLAAVNVAGDIYLIGGAESRGTLSNIDRYDHHAGTLTTLTTSIMPRRYHAAEAAGDIIYIISGMTPIMTSEGPRLTWTHAVEAYNISTGQVRALSPIPAARRYIGSAIYKGKIYVMGGSAARPGEPKMRYFDNVQIYDIANNRWSRGQRMPTARDCKVVLWAGKIYAVGGYDGRALSAFEVYDIETDTWEVYPDVPFRASAYSCAALDGKLYFFGDYLDMKRVAQYDIASGEWTLLRTNFTASRHTAASVMDDKIVVIGGNYSTSGAGSRFIQTFTPPRGGQF